MGKIGPLKIDVGSVQVPLVMVRVSPIFLGLFQVIMANPVNGFHWGYFTPKSVGAYPPSSEENPSGGDVDVWKTMEMPNSRPY